MNNKELKNLRILIFISVLINPLWSLNLTFFNGNLNDPLWLRLLSSFVYLIFFIGTYKVEWIKKQHHAILIGFIYYFTLNQCFLLVLNDFSEIYVNGYIFLLILVLLYLKYSTEIVLFSIFSFTFLLSSYIFFGGFETKNDTMYLGSCFFINIFFTVIRLQNVKKDERLISYAKELEESERNFNRVLESAPDAVLTINKEGLILTSNNKSKELFQNENITGNHFEILFPKRFQNRDFFDKFFLETKLIVSDLNLDKHLICIKSDGSEFPVEIRLSLINANKNEKELNLIVLIRDITQRIKDENELNLIKNRLQEKELSEKISNAKSEFISKMSHEIRTPLTSISGFSSILLKENLNDEQKKYIESIKFSSELLNTLINDILDNSNLEFGKISLETNKIDIKELIQKIIHVFKINFVKKEIDLELSYSGTLKDEHLVVVSDGLRLSQIIMNLISNAIKFSYQKGKIEIHIFSKNINLNKIELEISIVDYGIGISEDKFTDIFQPYIQGDIEISKKYEGNGLGLSIVKNLLEIFNGEIELSSNGKTIFTVRIPLIVADTIPVEKNKLNELVTKIKPKNDNFKILLVEDNELNQFLISTILEKNNLNFKIANNGQFALDELNENADFDLVIMDIMMPIMDGVTCTKIIKDKMKLTIPIIAFTADVKSNLDKELIELFDGYIKKPFIEKDFLELIDMFKN